jgi:hypothetical protein
MMPRDGRTASRAVNSLTRGLASRQQGHLAMLAALEPHGADFATTTVDVPADGDATAAYALAP